jgi:hypothetical protein
MLTVKYPNENFFRLRVNRSYLGFGVPEKNTKLDIIIPGKGQKIDLGKIEPMKREEPFIIPGPGEYEVSGTQIVSLDKGYWRITTEGWKLAYLLDEWEKPSTKMVEKLGQLDLIFIHLEGDKKEAKKAEETVKRISPDGVVFSYKLGKDLLDKIDREDINPVSKIKVKQADITEEGTDYFALSPK